MYAYAGAPGTSCADAIELGKDYSASIQKGQSIWYSAWTFDLPLTVTFAPANGASDPAPEVEMDFTCTPGFYEDSILCSLFCQTSSASGIQFDMPHKPKLDSKTLDNGTFVYYLSLGKTYRDLLLQMGISYNLAVYVKVTYNSNGIISMAPDEMFSNCVDNAKFMHLGDTVHVAALDKNRHVVVPYVQWQNDTIRYKWTGTAPCTLAVANLCGFDPTNNQDDNIIQFTIDPIQPGDSLTVTAALLSEYVNNQKEFPNEAGMYFAKFYSEAPGVMQIVKAPQAPPRKNATILRFDRTYALNANDTAVFAIPNSWNDDTLNTKFSTPTEHVFSMRIATDPDFSEEHTLKTYQFEKSQNGHWQGIFASEMVSFWTHTTEQYLYVRFDCTEATTVTPSKWSSSTCIKTSTPITSLNTTFKVPRASSTKYRFNYTQLLGGDLSFKFSPAGNCKVFMATDCDITLSTTADNLLTYRAMTSRQNTATIKAEKIAEWAERIDEDGYVYMLINHTLTGTYSITITSSAPVETDPTYPESTIVAACDEHNQVYVMVKKVQTIIIKNEAGSEVKTIPDAQPETKYSLAELPAGKYSLQAENETIEIQL